MTKTYMRHEDREEMIRDACDLASGGRPLTTKELVEETGLKDHVIKRTWWNIDPNEGEIILADDRNNKRAIWTEADLTGAIRGLEIFLDSMDLEIDRVALSAATSTIRSGDENFLEIVRLLDRLASRTDEFLSTERKGRK